MRGKHVGGGDVWSIGSGYHGDPNGALPKPLNPDKIRRTTDKSFPDDGSAPNAADCACGARGEAARALR